MVPTPCFPGQRLIQWSIFSVRHCLMIFFWSVERWSQQEIKWEVIRSPNAWIGYSLRWSHFGMRIIVHQKKPINNIRLKCWQFPVLTCAKPILRIVLPSLSSGFFKQNTWTFCGFHLVLWNEGFPTVSFFARRRNFFNDKQKLKRSLPKSWETHGQSTVTNQSSPRFC